MNEIKTGISTTISSIRDDFETVTHIISFDIFDFFTFFIDITWLNLETETSQSVKQSLTNNKQTKVSTRKSNLTRDVAYCMPPPVQ